MHGVCNEMWQDTSKIARIALLPKDMYLIPYMPLCEE